ncbi:MAG: 3D domain-containing protein [Syntrophomonadaceae bacterium]|nr:3D domain-containing protein [Syntrophomonadaceae bacterium]
MSGSKIRRVIAEIVCLLVVAAVIAVSSYYTLQKPVFINDDGTVSKSEVFFTGTVAGLLEQEQIVLGEHDMVDPALDTPIERYMQVDIKRAFPVYVKADGNITVIETVPVTVQEAVALAGVNVGDMDLIVAGTEDQVNPQQLIEIIRVSQSDTIEEHVIPYGTETVPDENMEKGLSRTIQKGVEGLSQDTIRITYHNGVEIERTKVGSAIVRAAETRVLAVGTITQASRGGQRFNFTEAKLMESTAYTYTGYNTATGVPPAVGLVSVDPRVIPLGTKLYIEGYGFATAADTGGAIKGDRLDVFLEEYGQCKSWGRRTVKVYILE